MEFEKRVSQHFSGIDELRNKAVREMQQVTSQSDMYSDSYIREFRESKKQELKADRQERANKAKEEIEQIKKELTEKKFKDPFQEIYDDPTISVVRTEHKVLVELQQSRRFDLLKSEIEVADSTDDFRSLLEEHGEYEELYKMINLEIKKRAKTDGGSNFKILQAELNQDPKEFRELKRLGNTVTFFGNLDQHPIGLDGGDIKNVTYEPLI